MHMCVDVNVGEGESIGDWVWMCVGGCVCGEDEECVCVCGKVRVRECEKRASL